MACGSIGVGGGQTNILSAIAVPLVVDIAPAPATVSGGNGGSLADWWEHIDCPYTTPDANDCPCTYNYSTASDALVHLVIASPDDADNSLWCFSSAGEDLCSFSWNKGTSSTRHHDYDIILPVFW